MNLGNSVPYALRGTAADILEFKGSVVHAATPRETVYDAIARMTDSRVGALLVMEGTRLVGIVSERDYTRKVILLGRASKETRVEEIMSAPAVTVRADTSLTDCMNVMTRHSFRHLPVVDEDDRVIGVLSIGDLVRRIVNQQAETIRSLNSFIGADYPT